MVFPKKPSIPSEVSLRAEFVPSRNFISLGMGHNIKFVSGFGRGLMGRGQVIQKINDQSGRFVWAAGSDPRADGHAAAQI